MAKPGKIVGVASTVAVTAGTAALLAGEAMWRRATSREVARLQAARDRADAVPNPRLELPDLPPVVARYFALAIPPNLTRIRAATIRWRGEFQMRPNAGWRPFEAEQVFSARPPGFVWDARIRTMPFTSVRVRDEYVSGRGTMLAKVAGLMTAVNEGGSAEMAAGALVRWLGEAVWFPTALLPDVSTEGVQWEAIDDSTARATVTDRAAQVSAEFHFAPTGEVTRMTAMRYRNVNGTGVLTPFEGRYHDYARRNDLLIPMSAEVAWLLPEGRFPYWRGRPVEVSYEHAAPAPSTPTSGA